MTCIYVFAPFYRKNSNGIRILYSLSEMLRNQGFDSKVVCYETETDEFNENTLPVPSRFNTHFLKIVNHLKDYKITDEDIVVYPEIIPDNPVKANNVIRYLLNRPRYLTGQGIEYGDNDYLVSYSFLIDSNLPQLFILNDDRMYFYPLDFSSKENLVSIYYGKGMNPEILDPKIIALIKTFKQKQIITREFPSSRLELGDLLRRSQLLISLDPISSLTHEATLCGTPSLIVDDVFGFSTKKFNIPLHGIISSPMQYDEAIKDVKLAFSQYEQALIENQSNVAQFITSAIKHFEIMNKESSDIEIHNYRQTVQSRNKSQFELDALRYKVHINSKRFTTIPTNFERLNPVGRKIRSFLTKTGLKRLFIKPYIYTKKWVQDIDVLARLFYKF